MSWAPPFRFRLRISLRCWISFYSLRTNSSSALLISFAVTLVMIFFALSANLRVEMVSSEWSMIGLTVAIRAVFVFPPRLSCNRRVIFDSL